jgi:3-deoxy-D-manno-octulosonic-acid transferase
MTVFFTLIYDCIIFCYVKAIVIASLFNSKAKKWVKGRKGIFLTIKNTIDNSATKVWFHCASLGEFEQCRPLIERYRESFPQHKIVLTFFSPSGYEVQKYYNKADYIFYLPYDSKRNAGRFINLISPKLAVFVKYEFWWHYLYTLNKKNIPAILVSGIFRKNQLFFSSIGKPFSAILHLYNHLFVQDEDSLQLLASLNITNVQIAHDTRFDRVLSIAHEPFSLPVLDLFCKNSDVFIAGSTWHDDEKILAGLFNQSLLPAKIKLIIAPHEINSKHIGLLQKHFNNAVLYSNSTAINENSQVLIIDSIGVLSRLYRYGRWAYVGGGFGNGIHNILEPAVYGLPVFFGPNWKKFNEAKNLLQTGGAFCINDFNSLYTSFNKVKNINSDMYKTISNSNKKFVADNGGGTEKILSYFKKLMQG